VARVLPQVEQRLDARGQRPDRRLAEEGDDRRLDLVAVADARQQPQRQERIAARVEEVVVEARIARLRSVDPKRS